MIELQNVVGLSDQSYLYNLLLRPDNIEAAKRLGLSSEKFSDMHAKHRAPVKIMNKARQSKFKVTCKIKVLFLFSKSVLM
jgi:hypothetical protein